MLFVRHFPSNGHAADFLQLQVLISLSATSIFWMLAKTLLLWLLIMLLIGLTEGTFKSRYNGHLQSIRHEKHETATELSKKYWEIKRGGHEPYIVWKIVKQVDTYKGGQPICNLCLAEKYYIIRDRGRNLLNSRTEILSKCRHRKKFLLNRAI